MAFQPWGIGDRGLNEALTYKICLQLAMRAYHQTLLLVGLYACLDQLIEPKLLTLVRAMKKF